MASVWVQSALWLRLALLASLIAIRIAVSVALIEIVVGAVAGNLIGLQVTDWVNFHSGFGAILLTFLAGAEIDPRIVRTRPDPVYDFGCRRCRQRRPADLDRADLVSARIQADRRRAEGLEAKAAASEEL